MKKLKLSGIGNMLTKDQMKKIQGGLYGPGCGEFCMTDYDCFTYSTCRVCHGYNGVNHYCSNI